MIQASITKVLSEIKLINKKIKDIEDLQFVVKLDPSTKKSIGDAKSIIEEEKSKLQKLEDLRARRDELKEAVAKANTTKVVKFEDKSYTIYQLILKKETMISHKVFLTNWHSDLKHIAKDVERANKLVLDKSNEFAQAGIPNTKVASTEALREIANYYYNNNKSEYVSAMSEDELTSEILRLEQKINDIDIILSEFNSSNKIEIPDTTNARKSKK